LGRDDDTRGGGGEWVDGEGSGLRRNS
jgi:hypothetical protein